MKNFETMERNGTIHKKKREFCLTHLTLFELRPGMLEFTLMNSVRKFHDNWGRGGRGLSLKA